MPSQVSELYDHVWGGDYNTSRLDIDRAEAGYELEEMLAIQGHDEFLVFEHDDGHFKTYPNVLNNLGSEILEEAESEALFRDLPNDGERSPRSRLACSMAKSGILPNVLGLSKAECCTNTELADDLAADECMFGFEELYDLGEDYDDMCGLFEGIGNEESRLLIRQLCDSSPSSGRPAFSPTAAFANFWRQEHVIEDTLDRLMKDNQLYFVKDLDGNLYDGVDEFQRFCASHMAGGGSINSAIVTARLSEFEDRYLASEAEEEAAEDLRCALLRLKEGTIECVYPMHHHPLRSPPPPPRSAQTGT